jgi:glyoxylase-like metal-dependent hydrolase (beta-lactamase superfamily II)
MLEDDFTHVLRKALAGHGLTPGEAAARAGVPEEEVLAFLRGAFRAETARKIAPVLGLNARAFAAHDVYQPKPPELAEITRLDLPFGKEQVNAWLLCAGGETILFDAGCEARDLERRLERNPDRVFITHAHRDHTAAVDHFLRGGIPVHAAGIPGTIPTLPGAAVFSGPLRIRACDLAGHAVPALGFHIEGLRAPVLVTGDALFAGSIGGCASPALYQEALRKLRAALAALPDETLLLPGHGPATTLGGERAANPFL